MRKHHLNVLAAVTASTMACSAAMAHEDIQLTVIDGRIVTGDAHYTNEFSEPTDPNEDPSRVYIHLDEFHEQRVFEGRFDASFFTDDPGLNSGTEQFTYPSSISFNILSPLAVWTGGGFVDLDPDNEETLRIKPRGVTPTYVRTGDVGEIVAGFPTDVRDPFNRPDSPDNVGRVHFHWEFFLDGPNDESPRSGIYLLELQLLQVSEDSSVDLAAPSRPFWTVFATDDISEADLDAAVDYVNAYIVPEPASLALLGVGGVALVLRRRRAMA